MSLDPVKLTEANLGLVSPNAQVPSYDRRKVSKSIFHVGVGGFHRAHQAVYADDLFALNEGLEWGYCGIGLLKHDARMRDVMAQQNNLYTLVQRSAAGDQARIIGSIVDFLFAPDDREKVLSVISSEQCKILSLTITEGGYYVNQGTGELDAQHPDIEHDLAHPHEPQCSFGYIIEALDRRRRAGLGPFTVMSCDNLQGNGDIAKKMLLAFAELRDPSLANWLRENCAFPNGMVDRITPATTDEHRALVREKFGIEDGWPVMTESFKQWVIEDHFPTGRPAWEKVGAQMTSDVLPYEKMKLRLLNASHQAICYIGMLCGYEFAHEAMADARIRKLVRDMMDKEVTPILPPVPGIDLEEYKNTLIERFANPAIRDQLSRIGTEGSARIPKFVLPSIFDELPKGGPIRNLTFTVATWFRYLNGKTDDGKDMPIIDPIGNQLHELAKAGGKDPRPLLGLNKLFGDLLPATPVFVDQLKEALRSFYEEGTPATLMKYTGL